MRDKQYIEGYKAALQTVAAKDRRYEQEINRILNGTLWGRLTTFFAKKKCYYEIKIVYEKANTNFADEVRKVLCSQGHSAYAMPIDHYKNLPNNPADYVIFIDNCDNIALKNGKIIIDQFGCKASVQKKQIIISFDEKKVNNENIDSFAKFYNEILSLNKGMEKYNANRESSHSSNFSVDSFEGMIDKILKKADDIEKKYSSGRALTYLISNIPKVFVCAGIAIPASISEELFKDVSGNLKSFFHRKKYVPICQKQIIEIMLCEYFSK